MTFKQVREYLWNDFNSMEELLSDELFRELHKLFRQMESSPIIFPMDELKIMNEAGLGVEWLRFNYGLFKKTLMEQLVREVYADMGLKDHAEAVLSMIYAIVSVVNWPSIDIPQSTLQELRKMNQDSWCGHCVNDFILCLNKEGKLIEFPFNMSEETTKEIRHITKELQVSITEGINKVLNIGTDESLPSEEPKLRLHAELNLGLDEMGEEKPRMFSLDDIVDYAQKNFTLELSAPIQNMLYALLVEDGTKEERAKVASIPNAILNRMRQPYAGIVMTDRPNVVDATHDVSTREKQLEELPTREEMIQAITKTVRDGYWWAARAWAVVYRVYQMKGYMSGVSQFVREVKEWKVKTGFDCTYDSVQKPIAQGVFIGNPDKWEANGAQGQAVKLAQALLKELEREEASSKSSESEF